MEKVSLYATNFIVFSSFSDFFFFKSQWVCASTVLGNQLRLVDIVNRLSDLAAQLCSEITPSDSQQVRNKMESLEERKLEINFRSCVVISKSEQHAKILGKIFGDNSVLFSKVICLWESRLLQIFSKSPE